MVPFVTNERRPRLRVVRARSILFGPGPCVQSPDDRFFDPEADGYCPVCGNHSLRAGEYVDVGVGYGLQVQPDTCDVCGYAQPGYGDDNTDVLYVQKCWELQLDAYTRFDSGLEDGALESPWSTR